MTGEAHEGSGGTRSWSLFWGALMRGVFAIALLLLALRFVSYAKATAFLGWYGAAYSVPAKAGNYLTEEAYHQLSSRLPIAAGVFAICGGTLAVFKRKLARFLLAIPSEWPGVHNSLRHQFPTQSPLEIGMVFSVFIIGIFLRVWHLGRAVRYDEAWTYVEFASRPLVVGLSNYRTPNNHLLHTLLVHFSTRLFANTTFGLRFPAFVAGCLVIPASWFVARTLYGQLAGILTAGCVAALPAFIEFSVNARGYSLQWLSVLAVMWFGVVLQENRSLRIGWLGLVLATVAGIYSIPTTLIAVAGVFGWMLASPLADGEASKLKSVLRNIALAGIAIGLLSLLLYVPPLVVRGPSALMAKSVVEWQQADFMKGFEHMGQCAWVHWAGGVPPAVLWILLAGLVVGLLFQRRVSGHRLPMMIALWLAAALFAWAGHVFAFPRVWSYLLLSTVMTACAGLSLVLTSLAGRSQTRRVVLAGLTAIYELLRRSPDLYGSLVKPEQASRVVAVVVKRTSTTELCTNAEVVPLLAAQETAEPKSLAERIDLNAYTPPQLGAKFLTSTVYFLIRRGRIE